ncbi:MAG: hypothetical protein FWC58_07210 [Desulfobulbus sp.]|nr:hypothetical protein [Desulfobulbus sp.]
MAEPSADERAAQAALESTLAATAAVLPLLVKPRPPRFPAALNERWLAAGKQLRQVWARRQTETSEALRQAVFALYAVALDSRDADCLALGEALASAADRLDHGQPPAQLLTALCAAIECLAEPAGLEHDAFAQRARHFAQRLTQAAELPDAYRRSPLIDRLFVSETEERLTLMREALAALPPDAVRLKAEAAQLAEQAEMIELYGLMHLARGLAGRIGGATDLEHPAIRADLENRLRQLRETLAVLDGG